MSRRRLILVILSALLLASFYPIAADQDWPQWRGPSRDGVADGVVLPDSWPQSLEALWKVEVGEGDSSPVVAGGKVVVMGRQGETESIFCLSAADGKEQWRNSYPAPYTPLSAAKGHNGPLSTPTVSDGKVYTFGTKGVLSCLDLDSGKLLWRKDFADQYKSTYPIWGAANSPLIEKDLCILGVGGQNNGALTAFNKNTGKVAWQYTGDGPGYASPMAVDLAGVRQIATLMQLSVVGVDARTGKEIWKVPFKTQFEMNIVTPVIQGDKVIYTGFQEPTHALKIAKSKGRTGAEEAWSNPDVSMYTSSPVLHKDHFYGVAMRRKGLLVCLALEDGSERWASPSGMGRSASIVRVGDKLLVLTFDGELVVVAADPSAYRELGRCKLVSGPVWAHLALTENYIYVKDSNHLTCFELPRR